MGLDEREIQRDHKVQGTLSRDDDAANENGA